MVQRTMVCLEFACIIIFIQSCGINNRTLELSLESLKEQLYNLHAWFILVIDLSIS